MNATRSTSVIWIRERQQCKPLRWSRSRCHGWSWLVALTMAFSMAQTSRVQGDDWPQWRGPNRDGTWRETGILRSFPASGLKIRWRMPVGGGWSSPTIAGHRVFLTDSQFMKPKAIERVLCFDEDSGRSLWTYTYDVDYPDWAFVPSQGGQPTATPCVEGERCYSVGSTGQVFCLEAKTGKLIWKRPLDKDFQIPVLSCRGSPLLDGELLILQAGGKPGACVVALNKLTGAIVWKALDEGMSNSSPIVITAGGQRQLIMWTGESLSSLDPATGKLYWREKLVTSNNDSIPTPVVHGNRLLVGGLMLELSREKPGAKILWPDTKSATRRVLSNTSTALFRDNYVYSARMTGELVCLEAATGKQLWMNDKLTAAKNGASVNPTPNGNLTFLFTDEGNLILAELSPAGCREISRAHLIDPTTPLFGKNHAWVPPAYANGNIYVRSDKELVSAALKAAP
jgi:outer membrane protein assembly factor BamB